MYFTVTGGVDGVVRSGREGASICVEHASIFRPVLPPTLLPLRPVRARAFVCVRSQRQRRCAGGRGDR